MSMESSLVPHGEMVQTAASRFWDIAELRQKVINMSDNQTLGRMMRVERRCVAGFARELYHTISYANIRPYLSRNTVSCVLSSTNASG